MNLCKSVESVGVFFMSHGFHRFTQIFYLDIFATKNLEQMVQLMASEIIGKLDTVSQSALRKVQEFFSSWRPTLTSMN